jgi:uncharacterized phage infection (PIP) family protein YhgE
VNHDKGTSIQGKNVDIGGKLVDNLKDSDSKSIKWVEVDSEKEAQKGLDKQKYYGAAILEKDFSKNAMSKTQKVVMDSKKAEMKEKIKSGDIPPEQAKKMQQSAPKNDVTVKQAHLKTLANGGANMQASQMASNVLKGVGENINKQITKQSISTLEKQDVKVSAKDINSITNPVKVNDKKVNEVKDHQGSGNAPFLMFMPVWISSIVGSILLFYAFRSSRNITIVQRVTATLIQIVGAIVTAFIGGFGYIYFMSGVQGFEFDDVNKIALFVSIAILSFMGLIIGVMTWLGMKSIPIFFIAMFFSMQLVTLPKQLLPKFYQDYIVDWNPFTHYANTIRELIYMHQPITMNTTMWMFVGFMIFGAISSLIATIVRKHSNKTTEIPS